ncbi:hypothetical protein [Variovorax boronicumulans]|uniref:hypothetical protein n=1 Tax=Variovorax boronicumulans TaxID=436515 RepID=UPI003398DF27
MASHIDDLLPHRWQAVGRAAWRQCLVYSHVESCAHSSLEAGLGKAIMKEVTPREDLAAAIRNDARFKFAA